MKLQTQIPLKAAENPMDFNSNIVLFGSCFSEHIGDKLNYFKFNTFSNPFGILFHTKAIETLIEKALSNSFYTKDDVFFLNEQYQCFDAHSKLNQLEATTLVKLLNTQLQHTKTALGKTSHVIITLGTAWVYKHKNSKNIVANCHKVPQQEFQKELLPTNAITESLAHSIALIKKVNPGTQFLFTVSPVRHIKDGFTENTLSKSHLISAIHQVISKESDCAYFPSYEIMMDELRDYRFYNEDMLHPNSTAIDYIWERFSSVWISSSIQTTLKTIDNIQKGLQHKPFNPETESHKKFQDQLNKKIKRLQELLPNISF